MPSLRTVTVALAFGLSGLRAEPAWAQYSGQLRSHLTLAPGTTGPKRGVGPNADTVTIVPIMWSNASFGCGGPDFPTVTEGQLDNFYITVAYSSYYGWIQHQYNTALALSAAPAMWWDIPSTSDPKTGVVGCPNPTQPVIENELRHLLVDGFLPKDTNGNTSTMVYAIHFPKNLSSSPM